MANTSGNYKRIAKNTLMLYVRMLFVMFTSLFTVRIILAALGQQDYGLYNVIGGIVVMFSFLTHTLSAASQRFYSFNIGRNEDEKLCRIYSNTVILFCFVVLGIVVLAETIGLWFLNSQMTIPTDRILAANIIYQFTILSFCWKVFTSAHQALIIAYEQMSVYAYVSVAEVVFQLLSAYLLTIYANDRLILYGILMFFTHFLTNGYYIYYSKRNIKNIHFAFRLDKDIMKEITSYCGWTIIGMLALVVRSSGINIVLNVFFNPIVNAARGIAFTVNSSVISVVGNFYTAVRPQIVKSFSSNDIESCYKLIIRSTKFSYSLALLLVLPLFIFAPSILNIWLLEYPEQTVIFVRLTLINALVDSMSSPMTSFNQATGNIRTFQMTVSILLIMSLPVTILAFKMGAPAEAAFVIALSITLLANILRLFVISKEHGFPAALYLKKAILPLIPVTIMSTITIPIVFWGAIRPQSILQLVMCIIAVCLWISLCSYFLGFDKQERNYLVKTIKGIINQTKKS